MNRGVMTRRRALQALGALALSGVAGRLLSASQVKAAVNSAGPGLTDFNAVSRTLTGTPAQDPVLALAVYGALRQATPGFDAALAALKTALEQGACADVEGRLSFGDEGKAQAALAQSILQAWYLGVAGKGAKATCFAFIDTLANRAVAAQLVPPSYSYGACGTWSARPDPLS